MVSAITSLVYHRFDLQYVSVCRRFDFIVVLTSFISMLLHVSGIAFCSVTVLPLFRILRSLLPLAV